MSQTYPGWKMVVFYDETVPVNIVNKLNELDVITINATSFDVYGMFWRFFANQESDCEYVVFRDTDSRISEREKMAVDEWIKSGKSIHIMRDHPAHKIPTGTNQMAILGGMWGLKSKVLPITEMILKFQKSKEHQYGNDQSFLKMVYNALENDKLTHDEFFEKIPFPIKRENGRFIGERIDENDNPLTNDHKILL